MLHAPAPILIVSGPSGSGKSTVSRLLAAEFERSALVEADAFMAFVAAGWVEPNLPEAEHQNQVVGGAFLAAALEFAVGGYTTVIDGHLFPQAVEQMGVACGRHAVPLHYAVLRADLDTCWARASSRAAERWPLERTSFVALHARFANSDLPDRHAVETAAGAGDVAAMALAAMRAGTLAVRSTGPDPTATPATDR